VNPGICEFQPAHCCPPPVLIRALQTEGPVLVLTHERPDGDAIGSVMAAVTGLRAAGVPAAGFIQKPVARRYRLLDPSVERLGDPPDPIFRKPALLLVLDVGSWERTYRPPGVEAGDGTFVANVDHHPDNKRFGDVAWVEPKAASTASLVFRLLETAGMPVPREAASWLLAGLVMDTGGFRFSNTDSDAFRTAAALLDAGADHARVMDCLFFREPRERRILEAELLQQARFAAGGRLIYAILDPARIRALGLERTDIEGVIDVLRSFDGPDIAVIVEPVKEGVHVSLRSRSEETPVDGVARQLGGGGHRLAAGALVRNATVEETIQRILRLVEKVFGS